MSSEGLLRWKSHGWALHSTTHILPINVCYKIILTKTLSPTSEGCPARGFDGAGIAEDVEVTLATGTAEGMEADGAAGLRVLDSAEKTGLGGKEVNCCMP